MRTIVWFRAKDLRVSDHAPLREAAATGEVIPLFVLDPCFFAPSHAREMPHRIQFLLDSLRALEASLAQRGSRLVVVAGKSVEVVPRLRELWRADRVLAQRSVDPSARDRDRQVKDALGDRFELFDGETLLAPGTLRSAAGTPYSIFSAFARAFRDTAMIGRPLDGPRALPRLPSGLRARSAHIPACEDLGVARNPALLAGGEPEARERLRRFLDRGLASYQSTRDRLDLAGTSRLSADLNFGTLSVREIWARAMTSPHARAFLVELLWREFAYSTLEDRPDLLERPFRLAFADFPWRNDEALWDAWASGTTGYPVVDASARQLLDEGFVHNRTRMISASFLAKHLLLDWRRGEAHYMKYLTDGDPANNDMGWQWSVGCGCDPQPWFRIFNPVLQGEKFDPKGEYVRRWIPELARMPARFIHRPWEAPGAVLREAGVRLGRSYPRPMVDHRLARERFLAITGWHLNRRDNVPHRDDGKRRATRSSLSTGSNATSASTTRT